MKQIKSLGCFFAIIFMVLFTSCADMLMGDEGKYDEDIYLNYKTKTVSNR
jgi:hypothetical protein